VATRIEDGVEVFLLDAVQAQGFAKLGFCSGILFKSDGKVGPELRLVTLGVERRTTALISTPASLKTK
jgi:hypothetical protein